MILVVLSVNIVVRCSPPEMVKGTYTIDVDYCCERMKVECECGLDRIIYDPCEKHFIYKPMVGPNVVLMDCPFCKKEIF